jgi:RNA polymerase sigma-70 factor (ECF subfamily)
MNTVQDPDLTEITDENAVARACKGDADAFSFLYERNVTRIYNYIFYRIGSEADAEDLTARVFFRAFGHINTYVEKGVPFSAWLYRIAHNLIANYHRDTHRRKEVPREDQVELPHHGDHPEVALVKSQEVELLLKGIRRLSSDRQQLLVLKFVENLSNAEVAEIMGKSEGAIKSLYHRALISLRFEMDQISHPVDEK